MRPCWSLFRFWIVWPVTWARPAPVNSVQSAAVAKILRASIFRAFMLVSSIGSLAGPALPGLYGEKPLPPRMFPATFCQRDGRNEIPQERGAIRHVRRRLHL